MWIESLSIESFRNYDRQELSLGSGVNILIGANGMGKTNLLEGVYVLAHGRSYRARDIDLIRWGAPFMRLVAHIHTEDSERLHELSYYQDVQGKKNIKLNQVPYKRFGDMERRIRTVLFTPDDLSVVKGSPAKRRAFVDEDLEAFDPDFYLLRRSYMRVLSQRNELLKDIRAGRAKLESLAPWTEQMISAGSQMILKRLSFLARLVPQARRIHAHIAGQDGGFDVRYQSLLGQILHMDEETVQKHFRQKVDASLDDEIRRGSSLYGPQRDDLVFYQGQVDLRRYGSQGQQRTAVLCMKLAEVELYKRQFNIQPILLLDDVFSELDPRRQASLVEIISRDQVQTIITGTNIDLAQRQWGNMSVFKVSEGQITQKPF